MEKQNKFSSYINDANTKESLKWTSDRFMDREDWQMVSNLLCLSTGLLYSYIPVHTSTVMLTGTVSLLLAARNGTSNLVKSPDNN